MNPKYGIVSLPTLYTRCYYQNMPDLCQEGGRGTSLYIAGCINPIRLHAALKINVCGPISSFTSSLHCLPSSHSVSVTDHENSGILLPVMISYMLIYCCVYPHWPIATGRTSA